MKIYNHNFFNSNYGKNPWNPFSNTFCTKWEETVPAQSCGVGKQTFAGKKIVTVITPPGEGGSVPVACATASNWW